MKCKKGVATLLALAIAANVVGASVHAEGKSYLERIEALKNANWNVTPWRNGVNKQGGLPDDMDKLKEFFLQDEYFDGNLSLAEKILGTSKEKFSQYGHYNETAQEQIFNPRVVDYRLSASSTDAQVNAYKQQAAELLEGSWLDLVNGTDLMLHMKDGRVFSCAALLPDSLCLELIRNFTEEGREAAGVQVFNSAVVDASSADAQINAYKQQGAALLEGSRLELINGTDLMLHMKDGRVFNCADLLPDDLCINLVRTFGEKDRIAAELDRYEWFCGLFVALSAFNLFFFIATLVNAIPIVRVVVDAADRRNKLETV